MTSPALPVRLSIGTGIALVACLAYLASQAGSEFDAVRVRNSLIASTGSPADFAWTPEQVPAGFRMDKGPFPPLLRTAADTFATGATTLDKALGLARHLVSHPERSAPIEDTTVNAYEAITRRGLGWCSDFTQVFLGLANAAGIPVREWGMSFDGYGGHGHAFVEIYSGEYGKWVMLDPFYSWYPVDRQDGRPLSALEFRERLTREDPLASVEIRRIESRAFDFRQDPRLIEYYRRGASGFFLWWGNDVLTYDGNPLTRLTRWLPVSVSEGIGIVSGSYPGIRILPLPENAPDRAALERQHRSIVWQLTTAVVLGLALLAELAWWLRARRR